MIDSVILKSELKTFGITFAKARSYMDQALQEAKKAYNEGEVPVGAVIVRDGIVIAKNHNRREQLNDPLAHAEMLTISDASKELKSRRLSDCIMFVSLEPCPMCSGAMILSRLGTCFYAAADIQQGCCESIYSMCSDERFTFNTKCFGGLLEEEAQSILDTFFKERRKQNTRINRKG